MISNIYGGNHDTIKWKKAGLSPTYIYVQSATVGQLQATCRSVDVDFSQRGQLRYEPRENACCSLIGDMSLCQGILSASRETQNGSTKEIEHRQLNSPSARHRVDGEDATEVSHENGYGHIADHHRRSHTCPGPNDNQQRCCELGSQREVSDETGQADACKHTLDGRNTIEKFVDTMEKHEAAGHKAEQQQS